ncbi:universal stress protein [Actinoallomurus iriomotensis]|uniref:Universal stress protein n=1 Tax=Actinoallomurus iriomotensis TaxID=478107 RepID=A0A9W6RGG2_9ACTN|nr:universal stress protein [Actinoallomurus iriomotensis]GLY73602.1 universal stress protein [Actinoallomurus iriomotensis]
MIQPIVVGTDGSSRADLAVEWAADEATLRHRPLHIVHAAERWDHDMPFYATPGTCESLTETGEHVLAEAVERAAKARPGLPVTSELVFDAPVRALRSQGRRSCEIVVGHRGLGGFTGMLLGSTGLRLAAYVPVPTIVVRGEPRERRHEVLAGVDLSETPGASEEVLRYAFEAAALRDAWVHVVHAWQVPAILPTVSVCEAEAVTRDRLDDALAPWRARYPDVGVVEQTPRGHPVGALTACSSRAALLVIGPGCRETRLGSVAHGVIHHADCPVAIVGPPR